MRWFELPAPTPWPVVLAFGAALLFTGLLTSADLSVVGTILVVVGSVGWFRDVLPQEAEALLARRFAIVQVWRPIRHPVETFPLAICDAQSLAPAGLVVSERRYPGRIGQTYAITHNPAHRWYWFPRMRREEALVFKVYDSIKEGVARWTAHTAFDDPTSPPGARPRESIEIRTLALF